MLPFNLAFTFSGFRWTLVSISQCWLLLIFLETDSFPTGNYFEKTIKHQPQLPQNCQWLSSRREKLDIFPRKHSVQGGKKTVLPCMQSSLPERTNAPSVKITPTSEGVKNGTSPQMKGTQSVVGKCLWIFPGGKTRVEKKGGVQKCNHLCWRSSVSSRSLLKMH